MLNRKYNSVADRKNSSQSKKISEAVATKWLQGRIYFGVGRKYLGWQFPVYTILPGKTETTPAGPRSWRTPPKEDRYKWNPMLEHLQGAFRGLVWAGSTHVPFITVDLDRHSGEVLAGPHIREAMLTGRLLTTCFCHAEGYRLNWCVEVNPRNGSVKFFGWGDQPIPIDIAQKIGEQIQGVLRQKGILGSKDRREIFPFNHPQVFLPMRPDKTTIIDTDILPKCIRKQKDRTGKMVPYETYSALTFCQWLRRGGHYSERTLLDTLKQACANVPDVVVPVEEPAKQEEESLPEAGESERVPRYRGEAAENPNSFERQHDALLVYCRQMKRVVSQKEAMQYIRGNKLYTGSWEQNLARRKARVGWILKHISKTFDVSKCRGVRHDVQIGKYDQWARHHAGRIKGRDRRGLDEFGNATAKQSRYSVDWQFASAFLSVVEYCLVTSPNEDGSLPHVRAVDIWTRCYEGGLTKIQFNDRKWAICRDWLEKKGVLKVTDRNWHRDKAMRWKVAEDFHRLPQWWRREKKPSLLEAVPLGEFLEEQNKGLNSYSSLDEWNLANREHFSSILIRPPP